MLYFYSNPILWKFYLILFVPQVFITLVVYAIILSLVFPWYSIISLFLSGPMGVFMAWCSVLSSSGMISQFVITFLLMPYIQRVTFDSVLVREFPNDLVLEEKLNKIERVPFLVKCGFLFTKVPDSLVLPYVVAKTVLMYIVGLLPYVGWTAIFLQAPSKGLQSHARYFILEDFDMSEVKKSYRSRPGDYVAFGLTTFLLESIPILNVFFMFTNNLGAAIWAIELEHEKSSAKTFQATLQPLNTGPSSQIDAQTI